MPAWNTMDGITDLMPHTIRVSKLTSTDRYGKPSFGSWTPVRCLIAAEQRLVRATDGQQVLTSSVAYCYSPTFAITVRDKVELPDGTTPPLLNVSTDSDEKGVAMAVTISLG